MVGLRHYVYDAEDVDVACGRQVFSTDNGGANCDQILAFVSVFGDFEGEGFDCCDDFEGFKVVSKKSVSYWRCTYAGGKPH